MKFEKFIKKLGGHGVIYTHNDVNWLASPSAMMRIPIGTKGVLSDSISEMPDGLKRFIDLSWKEEPCELTHAELPAGNSGIKDAIRFFETEQQHLSIGINNDSYTLLENGDVLSLFPEYSSDESKDIAKALIVKRVTDAQPEAEIVGFIFPATV